MAIDRDNASLYTQAFYIVGGVFTSVGLIIINKIIMQYYSFGYVLTLTCLHFWFSAIALWLYSYFWKPIIETTSTEIITADTTSYDSDFQRSSTSSANNATTINSSSSIDDLKQSEAKQMPAPFVKNSDSVSYTVSSATATTLNSNEMSSKSCGGNASSQLPDDKLTIRFSSEGKGSAIASSSIASSSNSNSNDALTADAQAPILPSRSVQVKVAFANVASIVLSNFSLQTNSVGFYQIWKMLCIPCTVALSFYFLGKSVSSKIKLSLIVLLIGVSIATVTDVDLNVAGTVFGTLAVLSTSVGHIWLANVQKAQRLSGLQAYYIFVPVQAIMCTVLALAFEVFSSFGVQAKGSLPVISLLDHQFVGFEVAMLIFSCAMACASNIFGTTLMGITSALTFEVVSHAKTCLIFLLWFIVFPLPPTKQFVKILCGIAIAFAGMLIYGYAKKHENSGNQPSLQNGQQQQQQQNSSSQKVLLFLSKLDRVISDILDRDDEEDRDSPVNNNNVSNNNNSTNGIISSSSSNNLHNILSRYNFNITNHRGNSTNAVTRTFSRYKFVIGVFVCASVLVFLYSMKAQRAALSHTADNSM